MDYDIFCIEIFKRSHNNNESLFLLGGWGRQNICSPYPEIISKYVTVYI